MRRFPLPDFLNGAHAAVAGMRLLTLDALPLEEGPFVVARRIGRAR